MEGRVTIFSLIFFYPEGTISGTFYSGFHATDLYGGGGVRRRVFFTMYPELRVAVEVSLCYQPWMPYIMRRRSGRKCIEMAKWFESARGGTESAREGTESAREGTESAREGTESAREGIESAREGTESARDGTESALVSLR